MQNAATPLPTPPIGPGDRLSEKYWDAILSDPKAHARPRVPIQNRRLSEIPRHVLRVSCRRCDRIVEVQTADAVRLYGEHAIWKEVGMKLLDNGCQEADRHPRGIWLLAVLRHALDGGAGHCRDRPSLTPHKGKLLMLNVTATPALPEVAYTEPQRPGKIAACAIS